MDDNYRRHWPVRITGIAILFLAAALPAAAGSFSISPIRVELNRAHRTEVFTIRNENDSPLFIQVRTTAWSQENGEERYTDSQELLTTPPIFQLAANAQQIVRVALRRDVDSARELDYRLFFQEVPQGPKLTNALNVALRLSVPVFVLPATPVRSDLLWQARSLADGTMQIDVSNRGSAHLQITDFELNFGAAATTVHVTNSQYVLPGSHVMWTVAAPKGVDGSANIAVDGFSDQGKFHGDVVRIGS